MKSLTSLWVTLVNWWYLNTYLFDVFGLCMLSC